MYGFFFSKYIQNVPFSFGNAKKKILFFYIFSFPLFSQSLENTYVTLPYKEIPVYEILYILKNNTSYIPSYRDNIFDARKILIFASENISVKNILEMLKQTEKIKYTLRGKHILFLKDTTKKNVTLSGIVQEKGSLEHLIGASVSVEELSHGASTNNYAFYSLLIPPGVYKVKVSYIGFESQEILLKIDKNMTRNFELIPTTQVLNDILIQPKEENTFITSPYLGYNRIGINTFGNIPYFLGEKDIIQGLLLMPGISTIGEIATGINVRGASSNQNLVVLDEAIIFNSSHYFGLISVFPYEMVNDVELFKGTLPASDGGRIASAIHIKQREGSKERWKFSGKLGLGLANFLTEGPFIKKKGSFIFSARGTLFPINLNFGNTSLTNRFSFVDINWKSNFEITPHNKIYISGYYGNDFNTLGSDYFNQWGNLAITFRWNSILNKHLFSNHSISLSDYTYKKENNSGIIKYTDKNEIINVLVKSDFSTNIARWTTTQFGYSVIFHRIQPFNRTFFKENTTLESINILTENGIEPSLYFDITQKIGGRFSFYAGLRWSHFLKVGGASVNIYKEDEPKSKETVTDVQEYKRLEIVNYYQNLEPRISLEYTINNVISFKSSYNKTVQYIDRITSSITPFPSDIWKMSDIHILPQKQDMISFGVYKSLKNDLIECSIELYQKWNENGNIYKNTSDIFFTNVETLVIPYKESIKGIEFFIKKKRGSFSGWASYTLSRAEVKTVSPFLEQNINNGEYFSSNNDRTHQFSVTGIYNMNKRISFSSAFIYATGLPFSFPEIKYAIDGFTIPYYNVRNKSRISDYHRLDVSMTLIQKKKLWKRGTGVWTFSIYNVYARKNAFAYTFRQNSSIGNIDFIQYSVLGTIIPSVTYSFTF